VDIAPIFEEVVMPFWKRSSPEEEQRRLRERQEAEVSRQSLEAGGLPIKAKQRLSEEMEAGQSHLNLGNSLASHESKQAYQP